jgi:hypothetical protein
VPGVSPQLPLPQNGKSFYRGTISSLGHVRAISGAGRIEAFLMLCQGCLRDIAAHSEFNYYGHPAFATCRQCHTLVLRHHIGLQRADKESALSWTTRMQLRHGTRRRRPRRPSGDRPSVLSRLSVVGDAGEQPAQFERG